MKKLLVGLLAITTASAALADGHAHNMVRFTNADNAANTRSFDVSFDTTTADNGADGTDVASNNLALNYARAFGQWQAGLTYKSNSPENSGASTTIGLSGYYNMEEDLLNTCYFAFHYDMMTAANDDKTNTISLEYGHRWLVGSAWGMNLTFAPSVVLSQATTTYDNDALEDQVMTSVGWNWAKFDVLF